MNTAISRSVFAAVHSSLLRASASAPLRRGLASAAEGQLQRTPLYDLHVRLGGKMVPFAGWDMPVQYPKGILAEHHHCRAAAALFDVSHMGQLRLEGKDRVAFIEQLVVGDIAALGEGQARLSVFTNDMGGIIDDTVVTNAGDHLYVVVNAGCADKDIAHLRAHLARFKAKGGQADLHILSADRALIALQGPKAEHVLRGLVAGEGLASFPFMTSRVTTVAGIPNCRVTRCGYTGEDGFEISVPSGSAEKLASALLSSNEVQAAGLGSRDSLRLEAGLCLYGHDLNEDITPVEGALTWLLSKRRKEQGGFIGAAAVQAQLKSGVARKRVGFLVTGAPAREGATIHNATGDQIGVITSGTLSPTIKKPIAMGYINTEYSKLDTAVVVRVRGKDQPAVVSKMPFVPHNYKK